jgi:hypothetical protein
MRFTKTIKPLLRQKLGVTPGVSTSAIIMRSIDQCILAEIDCADLVLAG